MAIFISYPKSTRDILISQGPKARGLIWMSRVDIGYDMKSVISKSVYHTFFFLSDKFAYLISYAE